MKIEIRHDSLAKRIFEAASAEDKARAKANRFLHERYEHYRQNTQVLLTQQELNYLSPFLEHLPLPTSLQNFVEKSQQSAQQQQKRSKIRNYVTIALSCSVVFLGWGFWWRSQALYEAQKANQQTIELYRLSQDVRNVRSVEDMNVLRDKADLIVQKQLLDEATKSLLRNSGILLESEEGNFHEHTGSDADWTWLQLSGRIADTEGKNLSGAQLHVGGASFSSDSLGSFRIPLLVDSHADYTIAVRVEHPSFETYQQTFPVQSIPSSLYIQLKNKD